MIRRRNLHVRVSEESQKGWDDFARRHGVSLGAMVEALGLEFAKLEEPVSDVGWSMIEKARQIDAERRSRRRD